MYTSLINAVNDLEAKMKVLDNGDNNGCFMDKWRNGRAARSAENLTEVLDQVIPHVKNGKNLSELTETLKKVDKLVKKYNTMALCRGFKRTVFCCIGRKSNTQAKLYAALLSLGGLKGIANRKEADQIVARTKKVMEEEDRVKRKQGEQIVEQVHQKIENEREAREAWEKDQYLYDPISEKQPMQFQSESREHRPIEHRYQNASTERSRARGERSYNDYGSFYTPSTGPAPLTGRAARDENEYGSRPTYDTTNVDRRSAREIRMDEG